MSSTQWHQQVIQEKSGLEADSVKALEPLHSIWFKMKPVSEKLQEMQISSKK